MNETEVVLDEFEVDDYDFYRISVECHKFPSISGADDIDEGNVWNYDMEVDDEY